MNNKIKNIVLPLFAMCAAATANAQYVGQIQYVSAGTSSSTAATSTVALSSVNWASYSPTSVSLFSANFNCSGYTTTTSTLVQTQQWSGFLWVNVGSPLVTGSYDTFAGYGTTWVNNWTATPYSNYGSFNGYLTDVGASDAVQIYQNAYPLTATSTSAILSMANINFTNGISGGGIDIRNTTIGNLTVTGDMNGSLRVDNSTGAITVTGALNGSFYSNGTIGSLYLGSANNIVEANIVSGALTVGTAEYSVQANSVGSINVASTDVYRDHNEVKVTVGTVTSNGNSSISTVEAVEIGSIQNEASGDAYFTINDVEGTSNASDGSKVKIGSIANYRTDILNVTAASSATTAVNIGTVGNGSAYTVVSFDDISGVTNVNTVNNNAYLLLQSSMNDVNVANLNTGAGIYDVSSNPLTLSGNLTVGNSNGGVGGDISLKYSTIGSSSTSAHSFTNLNTVQLGTVNGTVSAEQIAGLLLVVQANGNITSTTNVGSIDIQGNKIATASFNNLTDSTKLNRVVNFSSFSANTVAGSTYMSNTLNADGTVYGTATIGTANGSVGMFDVATVSITTANGAVNAFNNRVLGASQGSISVTQLNNATDIMNFASLTIGSGNFSALAAGSIAVTATDVNAITLGSAGAGSFNTASNVTLLQINNVAGTNTVVNVNSSALVGSYTGTGIYEADKPYGAALKEILNTGTTIDADGDVTLQSSLSSVKVAGAIVVDGDLTVASGTQFYFDYNHIHADGKTYGTSVLAVSGAITGAGAHDFVLNKLDAAYNINSDYDNAVNKFTLIGAYDQTTNAEMSTILGTVEYNGDSSADADGFAFTALHMNGAYVTDALGHLNYQIAENTYIQDKYAKNTNQAEIAKVLDGYKSVDNGGAGDQAIADYKSLFMADNTLLTQVAPSSMSYAARQNMELAHMINMDTVYRVSNLRNYITCFNEAQQVAAAESSASDKKAPVVSLDDTYSVSVRNINGIADFNGDANTADSNFFAYGGLVNLDYIFNSDLFAGIGVGGFESKTNGEQRTSYAETQSIAVNAYLDYAFAQDFDLYLGATYLYGDNSAYRNSTDGQAKANWGSNAIGVFGGVKYTFKPLGDDFYVRPVLGANYTALLNNNCTEKQEFIDKLSYDGQTYNSLKSVVGVEVSYRLFDCVFANARALYLHEFLDNSYNTVATLVSGASTYSTFTNYGTKMAADSGIFGLGVSAEVTESLSVYLDYNAETSTDTLNNNINAGITYRF